MNKDQEIINEYNKKRNKEITEEHLYNIEKLKEEFKQKVINKYNEKLIKYLYENMNNWCEECEAGNLWMIVQKIKNGEFDNE